MSMRCPGCSEQKGWNKQPSVEPCYAVTVVFPALQFRCRARGSWRNVHLCAKHRNIHDIAHIGTAAVDGNTHKCTILWAEFVKIWFCGALRWNPSEMRRRWIYFVASWKVWVAGLWFLDRQCSPSSFCRQVALCRRERHTPPQNPSDSYQKLWSRIKRRAGRRRSFQFSCRQKTIWCKRASVIYLFIFW